MLCTIINMSGMVINYLLDSQTIAVVERTFGLMLVVVLRYSAQQDHTVHLLSKNFHAVVGIDYFLRSFITCILYLIMQPFFLSFLVPFLFLTNSLFLCAFNLRHYCRAGSTSQKRKSLLQVEKTSNKNYCCHYRGKFELNWHIEEKRLYLCILGRDSQLLPAALLGR